MSKSEYKIEFLRESGFDTTYLVANSVYDALRHLHHNFDDVVMIVCVEQRAYRATIIIGKTDFDIGTYVTPEKAHTAIETFIKWDGTLIPGENCSSCVTEYWHEIITG